MRHDVGNHCLRPDCGASADGGADNRRAGRDADFSPGHRGASHGLSADGRATLRCTPDRGGTASSDASGSSDGRVRASPA
jgi:hypothetical protein